MISNGGKPAFSATWYGEPHSKPRAFLAIENHKQSSLTEYNLMLEIRLDSYHIYLGAS